MCLPQGRRQYWEDYQFRLTLPNIDLLYIGASVLILLDRSYLSRFWTLYEAWLSFMKPTRNGLQGADEADRRCYLQVAHEAPDNLKTLLIDEWANGARGE